MRAARGCGLARYGDGLQRSLRSRASQMMNNGSADMTFLASAGEVVEKLQSLSFGLVDDDPLEH